MSGLPTALRPLLPARAGAGRDEQGRAEAGRGGDSSMGGALGWARKSPVSGRVAWESKDKQGGQGQVSIPASSSP